tara:strand:+ start:1265 stop:2650 length:1386 start_codon:yes stop_codon:yes gene_type:complete
LNQSYPTVHVIGAGLAGTEAAWQIAQAGIEVTIYEMRPNSKSPAHHTSEFAELVCSNSFGALRSDRAAGLLQKELKKLNSIVIQTALNHSVPAGGALAVDRSEFSKKLTELLTNHPLINVRRIEEKKLPPPHQITVLATGPLTSDELAKDIKNFTGIESCHFYDAASPIIEGESIDFSIAFRASRYDKGDADYVNCPMSKDEYDQFRNALLNAETAELKDFEKDSARFFEGCLPIEEIAKRGLDTMRFGPLKPIGLWDPRWGDLNDRELRRSKRPHAIVQLRKEDLAGKLLNLVGFQTNLKWKEQRKIIQMIPGLKDAQFVRFGVMHRNTFLESPKLLKATLQFNKRLNLFAAGQIIGTEGYAAAAAGGWLAGTNASRIAKGLEPITLPKQTMIGSLTNFISDIERLQKLKGEKIFQPMPANFGILPDLPERIRDKRLRYEAYSERSIIEIDKIIEKISAK